MLSTRRRGLRVVGLMAALALALTACGGDDEPASSDTDTTGGDTTTDDGGDTTDDGGETDGDPTLGADAKVGVVIDIGGLGDQSFNDAANRGLMEAEADFGIGETRVLEPDEGGENREQLLRLMAEEGFELILGNGFLFGEALGRVAAEFPDTTFAITDSVVEADNVASMTFAEEEGSYLMGMAAALKTKMDHIGFIGGVETDLIKKFEAGFVAGAESINPDIEIDITYLTQPPDFSGFTDPAKGKEAGLGLYEGGADVVYHAAGQSGIGLFQAAKEVSDQRADDKVWAIGVDSDQYLSADESVKEFILTSMLKKVDVGWYSIIESWLNGENVGGQVFTFTLADGGIDYATSGGFVDDIADQLDEAKQKIIDGEIDPPTTPEG